MPALKRIVRLATTAFFLSSSAFVSATEINFQEFAFANNAIVKNQYAPYGVKFDGFYFSDDPLISIDGAGIAAFSGTPSSPLPNPQAFVNFLHPVTQVSVDYGKVFGGFVQLDAIDDLGNLIGLGSISGGADVNITYNAGPRVIKSLILSGSESGGPYITGLRFDRVTGAVPEPEAWAMLIAGFAMAGTMLRRNRKWAIKLASS